MISNRMVKNGPSEFDDNIPAEVPPSTPSYLNHLKTGSNHGQLSCIDNALIKRNQSTNV